MDTIFYTNKDGSLQISKIIGDDGHIFATITDEACDECTIIASAPTSAEIILQLTALRDVLNNIIAANDVSVLPDDPIEQARIAARPSTNAKEVEASIVGAKSNGEQMGFGEMHDTDSGLGIGGINNDQSMPTVPSARALARVQRLSDTDTVCSRCGASKHFDGAVFTTIAGSGICDDCI